MEYKVLYGKGIGLSQIREIKKLNKELFAKSYAYNDKGILKITNKNFYIAFLNNQNKVVAYVGFSIIADEYYELIKEGKLDLKSITAKELESFMTKGVKKLAISSIGIDSKTNNDLIFLMLNATYKLFIDFAQRGLYVSKLLATANAEAGRRICELLGMNKIIENDSTIYEATYLPFESKVVGRLGDDFKKQQQNIAKNLGLSKEGYILRINNLCKTYGNNDGKVTALNMVNINVKKGELLTILGSSGSGKTTLLNMIGGIDSPDSGSIFALGEDITKYNDKNLTFYRKNFIGFVFQSFHLLDDLTVEENIKITSNNNVEIEKLLDKVGLRDKRYKKPNELSGGEKQRVAIARALAHKCEILLCDEPTGALDYLTSKQILQIIEDLVNQDGLTVILVTHNRDIAKMATHIIEMKSAAIISDYVNDNPKRVTKIDW